MFIIGFEQIGERNLINMDETKFQQNNFGAYSFWSPRGTLFWLSGEAKTAQKRSLQNRGAKSVPHCIILKNTLQNISHITVYAIRFIFSDSSLSGDSVSTQAEECEIDLDEVSSPSTEQSQKIAVLPLNSSWKLYTTRPEARNWDEKLVLLGEISTVQQFWAFYHHVKLPSHLKQNSDYFFFRRSVKTLYFSSAIFLTFWSAF